MRHLYKIVVILYEESESQLNLVVVVKNVMILLLFNLFSTLNASNLNDNSISFVIVEYPKERKDYPYGHAALRVTGAGYDHLYEFCVVGILQRGVGTGVLKIWNHAEDGMGARVKDGASVTLYKIASTPDQNESIKNHALWLGSCSKEYVPAVVSYEPHEPYHFLNNNCVTTVVAMFEKATGIKLPINNQGKTLSSGEYLGLLSLSYLSYCPWPAHTFMPGDLQDMLKNDNRFEQVSTDNSVAIDIGLN